MSDSPYIVDVTAENFHQVLATSQQLPVLIDFWADWCQPCKLLMPILAKLAEEYRGKFLLAKLNTEVEQEVAAQFGIRSIPTVKLFRDGRQVDEFLGALPEPEVRRFLDQHIPRESDAALARAHQQIMAGNPSKALSTLIAAGKADPDNPRIAPMLAQAQALTGDLNAASATLDQLPPEEQNKPEITHLRSQLYFEALVADVPPANALRKRLAADPSDSEAHFQLALHQVVEQDYESAMEALLDLMRRDRDYGDDAARKTLIKLFELLGDDPLVSRYRGRMASMLN